MCRVPSGDVNHRIRPISFILDDVLSVDTPQRPVKRVRFTTQEADVGSLSSEKAHEKVDVIDYLPLCSEYTSKEKSVRWQQPEDKVAINNEANMEAQTCRQEDNKSFLRGEVNMAYRDVYAMVHSLCMLPQISESTDVTCESVIPDDMVVHLSLYGARGLEDRTVPLKALERRLIRQQSIRAVQLAQQIYHGDSEKIRHVSMVFTLSARKFAVVMGNVDFTTAMIDHYNEEEDNANDASLYDYTEDEETLYEIYSRQEKEEEEENKKREQSTDIGEV